MKYQNYYLLQSDDHYLLIKYSIKKSYKMNNQIKSIEDIKLNANWFTGFTDAVLKGKGSFIIELFKS